MTQKGLGLKEKSFTTGNKLADAILSLVMPMTQEEQVAQGFGLSPMPMGAIAGVVGKKFLPGPQTLDQLLFRLGKTGQALNPRTLIAALRNPTTKEIATGGIGIQAHPYGKVPKGFMERGFLPPDLPATSENFIPDHALDILSQPALVKQAFEQGTLDELITNAFKRIGSKGRF